MGRSGLTLPLWRVIAGLGITQIIGWGSMYYAIGALSNDIALTTGWPKSVIFGTFSAALLLSGMLSRWAGRAVDRHGGRRLMAAGSIASALGCLLVSLAHGPWAYLAGWLVLGVAMRLALYDAAFASLAQIAGERTRRSISYLALYAGFASTIFWPLSHFLSAHIGWQGAFLVFAAMHLCICLPIHLAVLASSRGEVSSGGDEPAATEPAYPHLAGRERTFAMATFATAIALNGLVFAAISAHIIPLFTGLGLSSAEAVLLAAVIGPSQVAARLGEIFAGRGLKAAHLGVIAFGLLPLALAVLAVGGFGFAAALAFTLLYGASNGLITIAKGAVPLTLFGRRGYGSVLGTLAAPNLVLNALAPTLFSLLLEHVDAASGFLVALGFAVLSALAMAVLARAYPR